MSEKSEQQQWVEYREHEMIEAIPILKSLGFSVDYDQPHISGERYLMQSVTTESGKKLTLLGTQISSDKRVVIKITSDPGGAREIQQEKKARETLEKIGFAYQTFLSPQEILFFKQGEFIISIHEFIKHDCSFLERPIEEQFDLILRSFKAQEGAHATTYRHRRFIKNTLGEWTAVDYLKSFTVFKNEIIKTFPEKIDVLEIVEERLREHSGMIEQYCGFLTHIDFVPHNFRVISDNIYLLDHSSIRFGNKYEGWARTVNFMTLYNPKLADALVQYVKNNRTPEESDALTLMRIYRLVELMYYYTTTLPKSSSDLKKLNGIRVEFWSDVLKFVLDNKQIPQNTVDEYKQRRNSLRHEDEKKRQIGLH